MIDGVSQLAGRFSFAHRLSVYTFGDDDEEDDSARHHPHDAIGSRILHPTQIVDLAPNQALRVQNGDRPEETIHTEAGLIRLMPGDDLEITKASNTTLYPVVTRSEVTLKPNDISLKLGSRASHRTRGGWTMLTEASSQ